MFLSVLSGQPSSAQGNFFSSWENRVRATSAKQPSWAVPVFTPTSGLVQLARVDVIRQYTSTRTTTWNYGGSKGFNLIPWYRTEVDINLPSYIQHNTPKAFDGAGDLSALLKYRVLAAERTARIIFDQCRNSGHCSNRKLQEWSVGWNDFTHYLSGQRLRQIRRPDGRIRVIAYRPHGDVGAAGELELSRSAEGGEDLLARDRV